jgi:hypothetical protein
MRLIEVIEKPDFWASVPFLMTAANANGQKFNTTRILEGLIIAGITGAITLYGVQQKMDVQIAEIKTQMQKFEVRAAEDRAESIIRDRRLEDQILYRK